MMNFAGKVAISLFIYEALICNAVSAASNNKSNLRALARTSTPKTTFRLIESPSNCIDVADGFVDLSQDACELLAETYDLTVGGGSSNWGPGGNDRPKGCFSDVGYPNHLFFNHGGTEYTGDIDSKYRAVCWVKW